MGCIVAALLTSGALIFCGTGRVYEGQKLSGWGIIALGLVLDCAACGSGAIGCLPWDWHRCLCDQEQRSEQREPIHRDAETLAQSQIANNFDCIALVLRPSEAWQRRGISKGYVVSYGRTPLHGRGTTYFGGW
jgi:hypothetical protein